MKCNRDVKTYIWGPKEFQSHKHKRGDIGISRDICEKAQGFEQWAQ